MLTYTTIVHQAREDLGISLNEYALADIIYHIQNNPNSSHYGWCYASKEYLGRCIGVSKQAIHSILKRLYKLEILEQQPDTKHLRTTNKWYEAVVILVNEGKETLPMVKKVYSDGKESLPETSKESLPNNNIINNNNIDNTVPPKGDTTKYNGYKKEYIQDYIDFFNKLFNSNFRVTPARENKLKLRFKTYTGDEILKALQNLSKSKFHQGDNDRGWKADPDFLIRSDEQIDIWLNKKDSKNDF
jgi:hypothetical protein